MNQERIGKFIQQLRKEKKLTQEQLAEKLGVTNKSISRWENGVYMPDFSLFNQKFQYSPRLQSLLYNNQLRKNSSRL